MSTKYENFIKSTNIKTWIDGLRTVSGAVRAADMSVATIGAVDYTRALDGLSLKQAKLLLTTQGIIGQEQEDLLIKQGLIATSDRMSASLTAEAIASSGLNKEKQEDLLISLNLMNADTKELITENAVTEAKLRSVLAEKGIKGAKADTLVASILQTGQNTKEALSWDVLATKIKMATIDMAKWLFTTPAGWATLAIGAVVGLTVAYANLASTAETAAEAQEKLKEAESNLSSARDELSNINDRISEIQSKSGELGISDQAELDRLETERAILEDQVRLLELKKELSADKSNREAVKAVTGNKKEAWWTDSDSFIIRNTTGYIDVDNDGQFETYSGAKQGVTIGEYEKQIEEIEKEITELESKPDSKKKSDKLIKLREKKQEVQDMLDESRDELADIYLRDTELMGQITEDDPASVAAREKLQNEMDFLEQYIYTKEQLAKIKFDDFLKDASNKDVSDGFKDIQKDGEVTAQEVTDLANKFPSLSKYMSENGISAEVLAAEYSNVSNASKDVGQSTDEATTSLTELEKVSDNIKPLGTAFKELSDDGYITIKTLKEMKDAADLSNDEWADYEAKLLKAKVGSSEFNQVMSDLTYKILDNSFAGKDLNSVTEQQVAAILREKGVVNASAVAHDWLSRAKTNLKVKTDIAKASTVEQVVALATEAAQAGITGDALNDLIIDMGIFNNTNLDVSEKVSALQELGYYAKLTAQEIANIGDVKKTTINGKDYIISYGKDGKIAGVEEVKGIDVPEVTIPEITIPDYSGATKDGSQKNEALDNYLKDAENRYKIHQNETKYIQELQYAYDNLTQNEKERLDIVGKINEAYRDLADNRIKDIEHQIDLTKELHGEDTDVTAYYDQIQKIAHDEADRYREFARKQLGYYNDGVTDEQKAEIDADIEKTDEIQEMQKTWWDAQNSKIDFYTKQHENIIRDIEHARDMALEQNPYTDTTSYYKQMQDEYHKQAELLRALDPEKYKEEIQELQKTWWDAREAIVEWDWDNSNRYIEERNAKGDWALYGDSEYEAWQRVVKWLQEKYPEELDKIHEASQNVVDARYQHSQDWIDERNTYNDWALFNDTEVEAWERVVKWLSTEYPNDINKIKEAERSLFEARKKEFNKATDFGNTYLESKKTLLQSYYNVTNSVAEAQRDINKELDVSKTMYEYLDKDTRKLLFNQDDYNVLSEELLDIQYKADKLKRQYERDLNKSTLETVESITSEYQMQYETLMKSYEIAKADLEIAKKKQKLNNVLNERNVRMFINGSWQWVANTQDVINAKSELADAEYAKQVEEAGLTQQQSIDNLTKQQDELGLVVKKFEGGVIGLNQAVIDASSAISYIPQAMRDMLKNARVDTASYLSGGSSKGSGGVLYNSNTDYMSNILSASSEYEVRANNAARNAKIYGDGRSESTMSDSEAIDLWKKAKGHASGTRYTPGGLTKMGENGEEFYITSSGRLIPISQPTIGNIPSGGVVFNMEQMKNLRTMWDMSNFKLGDNKSIGGAIQPQQINQSQDNRIIINGMTVDSGSADGQALISALRRYVGNH